MSLLKYFLYQSDPKSKFPNHKVKGKMLKFICYCLIIMAISMEKFYPNIKQNYLIIIIITLFLNLGTGPLKLFIFHDENKPVQALDFS